MGVRVRAHAARMRRRVLAAVAVGLVAALMQVLPTSGSTRADLGTDGTPDRALAGTRTVVVTLITGDRVRVTELGAGRRSASLLPGSPSYGKPVRVLNSSDATYVIPQMSATARESLDYSMFDVASLIRADGDVPLRVRFEGEPRDLDGIDIDGSSARHLRSGGVITDATYVPGAAVVDAADWVGVESVRLAGTDARRPASSRRDYQMHTLTIKVRGRTGKPVRFADASVQNVDDERLASFPVSIVNGVAKVSVPEGHYSVVAFAGNNFVTNPDFAVDGDATTRLEASDATVRPKVSVREAHGEGPYAQLIRLQRTSERRGSAIWESFGRFPRLERVPARLPHGRHRSFLYKTSIPKTGNAPDRIFTHDARSGVPADMSFPHQPSDFARVRQDLYSNGMSGRVIATVMGTSRGEIPTSTALHAVEAPGRRSIWLQAGRGIRWRQSVRAPFGIDAEMVRLSRYGSGRAEPVSFLRGPVGPGLERGINSGETGPGCTLCRVGDQLRGRLPLWSSAGTNQRGRLYDAALGSWTLRDEDEVLQRGHEAVRPRLELPAGDHTYSLDATSRVGAASGWPLSTRVSNTWHFESANRAGVVPLLMPSYVPPTDLSGTAGSDRMRYRLNVDNLGPTAAPITDASVRYSTDGGESWREARLERLDKNSFRVRYHNPATTKRHKYVSLRITARDRADRSVRETAIRAYRLSRTQSALTSSYARNASASVAVSRRESRRDTPDREGLAQSARPACKAPGERVYRCYALIEREGRQALTRVGAPAGWGANELRDAYGLPEHPEPGQKVGVVVAFDYPGAAEDMNRYRRQYGLPPCRIKGGCFTKINQDGGTDEYPRPDPGWALEAALDLQMVSAACPSCEIVLSEANRPRTRSLGKAVDAAVKAGAAVTNHSYGIQEYNGVERASRRYYDGQDFTAVASSGDFGFEPASFPASSAAVLAVGGTVLRHANSERGWREHAWSNAGSGCSGYFTGPDGQDDPGCDGRTIADVSAVAKGVAVFNSFSDPERRTWWTIGGTSVSSPLVAGMVAAANAGGTRPSVVYDNAAAFHDITRGYNGYCKSNYICTAKNGYDGPTGLGTPQGTHAFTD